jgi:hypothetical protein
MSPWIVSRRADLLWFHGSVLAGLALLVLFALLPPLRDAGYTPAHPAVLALLLWGVLFDGTHVFGTYARSYLAPDAAHARLPGPASFALVALGPMLALIDHSLCPPEVSLLGHAGWLFRGFLLFAYLWAYWHLVRQHYGLIALYRRRANDRDTVEARLESALLWVGCLYPFLRFSLGEAYLRSGLPTLLPLAALPTLRFVLDLGTGAAAAALLAALIRRTRALGPRHLLMAIVVAFHVAVFAVLDNLLTITATLTIFHNLQYHRIVWQYEAGLGRSPAPVRYLGLGLLLGVAWYGPRIIGVALTHDDLSRNVLIGLGWGVAFHHYYVDGLIWRVRKHARLAAALDVAPRLAT